MLVAREGEGLLVSAVGVGRVDVLARDGRTLKPWLEGGHPLLGPPGLPERAPGVLQMGAGPAWFVGTVWGEPAPLMVSEPDDTLFSSCGVHL